MRFGKIAPMKSSKKRLLTYCLGVLIWLGGIAAAIWISNNADDDTSGVIAYEFVDGQSHPVLAGDSKIYRRDLERFGGKQAILLDDIARWFAGLWHGRRLAMLLVIASGAIALSLFWLAERDAER